VLKSNTDAILADIAPASVRRNSTLRLALKYALTEHFNNNLVCLKTRPRLKLRRSFAQSPFELMESFAAQESIAQWTQNQWLEQWKKSGSPPHSLPPTKVGNPDVGLCRSAWCKLNHLRRRVGRFRESLHRWKMAPDPWCSCGSGEAQTAKHIISDVVALSGCLEKMQILRHCYRLCTPG